MYIDVKPEYSRNAVNRAGNNIRLGTPTDEDFLIIENWRASHNHILNSWKATLKKRCQGKKVIFAQRLKRRNTIFNKLQREPGMQLARMHDIAGCRLIFRNIEDLHLYRNSLHTSKSNHILKRADVKPYPYDYIQNPKSDGYRGIHDIYEYKARSGRNTNWDGLLVEIQYRTVYQHAWATAVEIAGTLTGSNSKFNEGSEEQKEFFRLTSEILSRKFENLNSCKSDIANEHLVARFFEIEDKIKLYRDLSSLHILSEHNAISATNLILVFSKENTIKIHPYKSFSQATIKYFEFEKINNTDDVVLVRAESVKSVKKAFKNYFSDTKDFTRMLTFAMKDLLKDKARTQYPI